MLSLPEIFNGIVSRVSAAKLPYLQTIDPGIKAVNFQPGHWVEVCNSLIDKSKNNKQKYLKFPLVVLLEDIPLASGRYPEATLQLLVLHHTNKNWNSFQRQGNIYNLILDPIYEELLRQITLSKYFMQGSTEEIRHQKIDLKRLGTETLYGPNANILAEFCDGLALRDMRLNWMKVIC